MGKSWYVKYFRKGSAVRNAGAARRLADLCRILKRPRNDIRVGEDSV